MKQAIFYFVFLFISISCFSNGYEIDSIVYNIDSKTKVIYTLETKNDENHYESIWTGIISTTTIKNEFWFIGKNEFWINENDEVYARKRSELIEDEWTFKDSTFYLFEDTLLTEIHFSDNNKHTITKNTYDESAKLTNQNIYSFEKNGYNSQKEIKIFYDKEKNLRIDSTFRIHLENRYFDEIIHTYYDDYNQVIKTQISDYNSLNFEYIYEYDYSAPINDSNMFIKHSEEGFNKFRIIKNTFYEYGVANYDGPSTTQYYYSPLVVTSFHNQSLGQTHIQLRDQSIYVDNKSEENIEVSVLDAFGNLQTKFIANPGTILFDISDFMNGLYIIKTEKENQFLEFKKIIIQN